MDLTVWDDATIERYHAQGFWDERTLAEQVVEHARAQPMAAAFVGDDGSRLSWAGYERSSAELAAVLTTTESLHSPVAAMIDDSPEVHVAYLAAERAGNVMVGIGPRSGVKEISHLLQTTDAACVITGPELLGDDANTVIEVVTRLLGRELRHIELTSITPLEVTIDGAPVQVPGLEECRAVVAGRALGPDDLFFINSTSGSTGRPKCVMHTQNRWKYFHSRARHFRGDDVFMVVVPAPFGFGLWMGHFSPTLLGATTVITKRFDPQRTLEIAAREGVSVLAAVSSQLVMMEASLHRAPISLPALRVVQTGGERVPAERAGAFEDATGALVLQFYGSNEAGCVSGTTPDDPRAKRLGTAGRVLPEMQVRLFDDYGNDVTADGGPGQCGCLGPAIGPGYFGSTSTTSELFRPDGWLLLGDVVELDRDGYLSVIGRNADFVIRGGHNISAPALEEEIGRHPRVSIAAVVGVSDPTLGERVCAFVVTKDGEPLVLDELVAFLDAEMVSKASWPETVVHLDALPEGVGGKIAKAELRAEAERLRTTGGLEMRALDPNPTGR